VIDEISFIGVKIFNVIDNRLRSIKHIQKKFFVGIDGIMTCDFYQTPPVKDNWMI
jgi:predicted secreted protein